MNSPVRSCHPLIPRWVGKQHAPAANSVQVTLSCFCNLSRNLSLGWHALIDFMLSGGSPQPTRQVAFGRDALFERGGEGARGEPLDARRARQGGVEQGGFCGVEDRSVAVEDRDDGVDRVLGEDRGHGEDAGAVLLSGRGRVGVRDAFDGQLVDIAGEAEGGLVVGHVLQTG